ncbi:MAG: hypothetical protein Q8O48_10830 [Anaerolineales bacterium]|nr:hypothetical protein [Anaerolineales bacterium]
MYNLLKSLFGTPDFVSRADTTADSPDPDPNDVWAFTDPDARDDYARDGKQKRLEQDIRFEVMRAGGWQADELEFKSEIRRLLREGLIRDKGAYWFRSPHPTVYRVERDGALVVTGKTVRFHSGDDIVFQCRMERDEAKDERGPVLVARLQPTKDARLCGDVSSAMKGVGGME